MFRKNDFSDGRQSARSEPSSATTARYGTTGVTPATTSASSVDAQANSTARPSVTTKRRSKRSAMTPDGIARISAGTNMTRPMSPRSKG